MQRIKQNNKTNDKEKQKETKKNGGYNIQLLLNMTRKCKALCWKIEKQKNHNTYTGYDNNKFIHSIREGTELKSIHFSENEIFLKEG
jgi:hypothetical protein